MEKIPTIFAPERQESLMATRAEVEQFLRDFRVKMKIWGILFRDDRNKNAQTLASLELRPIDREKIVGLLQADDYCEGPYQDRLYNGADMWVFGREVKAEEVYIKITIGYAGSSVICISFHIAEYPLQYPLRG